MYLSVYVFLFLGSYRIDDIFIYLIRNTEKLYHEFEVDNEYNITIKFYDSLSG